MQKSSAITLALVLCLLAICTSGQRPNTSSSQSASDSSSSAMSDGNSTASTTAASALPPTLLTTYLVDIHLYPGGPSEQYIAYHYCQALFTGYFQCAVYNGTANNSRLIAVEIVVSGDIFSTLPMSERKLWHSHAFAIKNGLFVIPGVPDDQIAAVAATVINTYGKVVDFWHDYDTFPEGSPKVAYGITAESQINDTVVAQMEMELNLNSTRQERAMLLDSVPFPEQIEGADDYLTSGVYPQYVVRDFKLDSCNKTV